MPSPHATEQRVLSTSELPAGAKKTVKLKDAHGQDTEILMLNHEGTVLGLEAKCPHAGAPLEKGAVCNGRLVCPWHMGTFALPSGALVEPPPMRALKTYAVRVSGDDIFVDPAGVDAPTATETPVEEKDSRTMLLVGVGAAGAMAATILRAQGFTGRVVAVDPVADEPVDRTQLSKMALAGKMPLDKASLDIKDHVDERIDAKLTHLSADKKQATLSNGNTVAFDAALIATGGTPKRLDIPGSEIGYTIRHREDVRRILEVAEKPKHAVIIGTSFIGLEAASALVQKGLQVTVVGKETLPFAKKFGDDVAKTLKAFHESKGTLFHLGVEITEITKEGVHCFDKTTSKASLVPAELVILGVGVKPELGFEHDLVVAEKGGGIAVASDLRAAESVWVAGDIANVEGTRIEHWRLAEQHGQLAAKQMLSSTANYDGVPFFWTFHHGKRLGYLGHANDWDSISYDGSLEELTFLAYYVKQGKVAAILSCGRDTDTAMLAEVMRSKPNLEEARKAISK